MRWNPTSYLEFEAERARPFHDLLARVPVDHPELVVDLGCGPGNLTRTLADRWPSATVLGIDSSAAMVEAAEQQSDRAGVSFVVGDLRDWTPPAPVDVLVSNATLQWVPDHVAQLPRLIDAVRPGGWLAFQVPGNFGDPSHTAMSEVARSPRWAALFADSDQARPAVESASTYLELLANLGCVVDAWETTYLHVLPGEDAVVHWTSGTGLRPYLQALPDDTHRDAFRADYRALVEVTYPRSPWGTVLPFRRIFVVAQAGTAT